MRWLHLREASIPKHERDVFERFGPSVIGAVLYSGFPDPLTTEPQKSLYSGVEAREHAAEWLTEQYDRAERKETWLITMEAAITLFVAVELTISIFALWRPVQSAANRNAIGATKAAAVADWQRTIECSDQADRMAERGWASDTATGYVLEKRINHYSPKYGRCYVEVFFSTSHRDNP